MVQIGAPEGQTYAEFIKDEKVQSPKTLKELLEKPIGLAEARSMKKNETRMLAHTKNKK